MPRGYCALPDAGVSMLPWKSLMERSWTVAVEDGA
jgi:hypothetical protein